MKPNFIEVCAGAGGLSTGLIEAGFKPIFLNENNKDCCKTLEKNHKGVEIKNCSFEDIGWEQYKDKVDLLTGGVPCQSFSIAGKRKGFEDKRGNLLISFIDICGIVKPKVLMIENVKGIVSHNEGNTIKEIIQRITSKGYNVYFSVLNAFDYKVPQKRERVFIIGIRNDIKTLFEFPEKEKEKIVLKDILKNTSYSKGFQYSEKKKKLFGLIPQGGCWIDLPEDIQKEYLGNSYFSGGGKRGILRKLSMDEPCLTLLCSPSQKQTERCNPTEQRPLNILEYSKIQTFPENYTFHGSVSSVYKQIGNAVPCNLSKKIGESIIKIIGS